MKNLPKRIYLNIDDDDDIQDFNKLRDVTWCQDKINSNDPEYVLAPNSGNELLEVMKTAYRKHHMLQDNVGWNELSDMMFTALLKAMGGDEFNKWVKQVSDETDL